MKNATMQESEYENLEAALNILHFAFCIHIPYSTSASSIRISELSVL